MLQIFVNLGAADSLPLKCRGGEGCCGKETSRHLIWSKFKKSLKKTSAGISSDPNLNIIKKLWQAMRVGGGRLQLRFRLRGAARMWRQQLRILRGTLGRRGWLLREKVMISFWFCIYSFIIITYFVSVFVSDWSSAKPIWVLQTNKKLADGLLMK